MRYIFLLIFSLLLISCATPYQKDGFRGGYVESQLSENIYRVYFGGNGYTSTQRAADFALIRAAELTIDKGYKFFVIISNDESLKHDAQLYNRYDPNTGGYTAANIVVTQKPKSTIVFAMFNEKNPESIMFEARYICNDLAKKYEITCNAIIE